MVDTPKRSALFIWWTADVEVNQIGPEAPAFMPEHVREQYRLRYASRGRGLLWADARFGARQIEAWPETNIARMVREGSSGGVVFEEKYLKTMARPDVPGLVTDFRIRIMVGK